MGSSFHNRVLCDWDPDLLACAAISELDVGAPFFNQTFFPFLRSTSLPFAGKELLCSEKLRVVGRSSRHATKLDPGLEFRKPRNVEENRNETFSHGYSR
jgi:cytochrome c biogenesis factor